MEDSSTLNNLRATPVDCSLSDVFDLMSEHVELDPDVKRIQLLLSDDGHTEYTYIRSLVPKTGFVLQGVTWGDNLQEQETEEEIMEELEPVTVETQYQNNARKRELGMIMAQEFTIRTIQNGNAPSLEQSTAAVNAAINILDALDAKYADTVTTLVPDTVITTSFVSESLWGSWNVQTGNPANQIAIYANKLENAIVVGQYENLVMTKALVFSGNTVKLQIREPEQTNHDTPTFFELNPTKVAYKFEQFLQELSDCVA